MILNYISHPLCLFVDDNDFIVRVSFSSPTLKRNPNVVVVLCVHAMQCDASVCTRTNAGGSVSGPLVRNQVTNTWRLCLSLSLSSFSLCCVWLCLPTCRYNIVMNVNLPYEYIRYRIIFGLDWRRSIIEERRLWACGSRCDDDWCSYLQWLVPVGVGVTRFDSKDAHKLLLLLLLNNNKKFRTLNSIFSCSFPIHRRYCLRRRRLRRRAGVIATAVMCFRSRKRQHVVHLV